MQEKGLTIDKAARTMQALGHVLGIVPVCGRSSVPVLCWRLKVALRAGGRRSSPGSSPGKVGAWSKQRC
jgi:hypothetical protein